MPVSGQDLLWSPRLMDYLDAQTFPQPRIGDVVGKYRLDRVVGAGGMGMVFAATHLELDRQVAVKFVHNAYCQNPEVIARFVREARAVVRIESEHVAKVIDVGHAEGGTPYMVMEYLDGEDLSSLLKFGPLAIPDAVDYIVQTCSAMQEAHDMGIVHRDLKPANLFLTHRRDRTPLIKVLDFGISKLNDAEPTQAALTNPAMLMGSPAYMSPEQLTNPREVDPRTDLWSIGVILFELLAGRPAFQAQSLPLLMTAIMQQEPADLVKLRPDVPPGLVAVVARCLEKSAEQRFQTVSELVTALLPFAPRRSHWSIERIAKSMSGASVRSALLEQNPATLGSPVRSPSGRPPTTRDGTRGEWSRESDPAPSRGGRRLLYAAVGVGTLGLAAGGWLLYQRTQPSDDAGAHAAGSVSSNVEVPTVPTVQVAPPGAVAAPSQGATQDVATAAPEPLAPVTPLSNPLPPPARGAAARTPARATAAPEPKRPDAEPRRNPLQMDIK